MVICFKVLNKSDLHSVQQNIQLRDQTAFRKERKIHNAKKFNKYGVIHYEIPEEVIYNDSKVRRTNSPTAFSYDPFKPASLNTTSLLFSNVLASLKWGKTGSLSIRSAGKSPKVTFSRTGNRDLRSERSHWLWDPLKFPLYVCDTLISSAYK